MPLESDLNAFELSISSETVTSRILSNARAKGGDGDDHLNGTRTADWMVGWAGNDTLMAFGGDDVLKGFTGNDILFGGTGNDVLYGGHGDDQSYGGADDDILFDNRGNDFLNGGGGNDFLFASGGQNQLYGERGDDMLIGGIRADVMDGGSGNDILSGGSGNDTVSGGSGDDHLHGYFGDDVLNGNGGADTLYADGGDDILRGGSGNDIINKYSEIDLPRDTLIALFDDFEGHTFEVDFDPNVGSKDYTGADRLFGGSGDDTIYIGKDDQATGGEGADTFVFVHLGRLSSSTARIRDFDAAEDEIVFAYRIEPNNGLNLTIDDRANGNAHILLNDRKIGVIVDGAGFDAADITIQTDFLDL